MRLIIYLFLLLSLFGQAFAKEHTKCDVVEIYSFKAFQAERPKYFRQQGVGWIYKDTKGVKKIVTPAHVIDGGDIFAFKCPFTKVLHPAKIEKKNLDIDLASLTFTKEWQGKPRLDLTKHKTEIENIDFNSVNNDLPFYIYSLHLKFDFSKNHISNALITDVKIDKQNVIGSTLNLITDQFSIRPGMSGTPLLFSYKDNLGDSAPAGMLIRSKINSSSSLAINIKDIYTFLKEEQKAFFMRTTYHMKKDRYKKKRFLKIPGIEGEVTEVCNNRVYKETNKWNFLTAKKNEKENLSFSKDLDSKLTKYFTDKKIDPRKIVVLKTNTKSGGDWGDGGDALKDDILYSGYDSGLSNNGTLFSEKTCRNEGIKIFGKTLMAIYDHDRNIIRSITSLDSLKEFINEQKDNLETYLKKYGQFKEDNNFDMPKTFCKQFKGTDYNNFDPYIGTGSSLKKFQKGEKVYIFSQNEMSLRKDKEKWRLFHGYDPYDGVVCDGEDKIKINVQNTGRYVFNRFQLKIDITKDKVEGQLLAGVCVLSFDIKSPNTWNFPFKSSLFNGRIRLSPNPGEPRLKVSILKMDRDCAKIEDDHVHHAGNIFEYYEEEE